MFDETFKQQVMDKLISLIETPNFDKTYTVVLGDSKVTVYLNGKETFRIYPSYGGGCHSYHMVTSEYRIDIKEYDGDHYDQTNESYIKALKLWSMLCNIAKKREEKQKQEVALQKEREQQNRLLAEKKKQDNILSGLDGLITTSMGYSK